MSKLSTEPYRGTRDFPPRDMFLQTYIFTVWRTVCQRFGYEEYMTPTVEPLDLYTAKTSEEIVSQQTYSFEDRGGRKVTIRPEMTPSVARLVAAQRQELGYPLRLFSIPNCMRYERPQKGRLREFWQLNADLFGDDSLDADFEIILLADAIMKEFGATDDMYEIRINSRKLMNETINSCGLKDSVELKDVVNLIDKKSKMNDQEFYVQAEKLVGDVAALMQWLEQGEREEANGEVHLLMTRLHEAGASSVVIAPDVVRGFDYYTDIVFEVFDKHPENNRSMFGGGRYDDLVGLFGSASVPTVGFGKGDATLLEFLRNHELLLDYLPATELLIASLETNYTSAAIELAQALRTEGLNVATDTSQRKPEKKIKNALKTGIPFMVFVGQQEVESKQYLLKNLADNTEAKLDMDGVVEHLDDYFSQSEYDQE